MEKKILKEERSEQSVNYFFQYIFNETQKMPKVSNNGISDDHFIVGFDFEEARKVSWLLKDTLYEYPEFLIQTHNLICHAGTENSFAKKTRSAFEQLQAERLLESRDKMWLNINVMLEKSR
jgi:hypothetical protein